MCARIEAEKVRKSISTFAPLVTNSPLFTYLAKLGPLSACSRTRRADRAALRPEHAPRRTRTPSLLIRSQALYPVELWARVGGTRLELVTSTMSTWRSNQLS